MATRDEILRFVVKAEGGDELLSLARDIKKIGDESGKAEKEASELLQEFGNANRLQQVADRYREVARAVLDYENKIRAAKAEVARLGKEISSTEKPTKEQRAAFEAAKKSLEKLTATQEKQRATLSTLRKDLNSNGVSTRNLSKADAELEARAKAAAAALKELLEKTTAQSKAAKEAAEANKRWAKSLSDFRADVNTTASAMLKMTGLAGAISAALGTLSAQQVFGDAITSATSFEKVLTTIGAVTGANAQEMARFKKAAEDATRVTNFSAAESAEALLELAKASGDAAAATAQLAPTLNLAQAAGIDTAESATILTTTLTQFGLAATDATRVADLFVTEANSTEDSVSKLGNAMRYVAPLARNLGLSLEETTAIIGALAKEGFKGETAGTALRNVFLQLSDPASKFREALRGIGITSTNFIEVMKQIVAAGDRGKIALLELDAEARPAIQALVNSGAKNLDILLEALLRAGGESQKQAQKMGDNFDGASRRLMNAFDQLRRDLVEPILTPVADQFDDVAERVRLFAETADFAKISEAIKQFAIQATEALIELGKNVDYTALAEQIKNFSNDAIDFFKNLKENASATLDIVSAVVNGMSAIFNSLQAMILSAATVISGVLAGIAAAALKTAEALRALPGAGDALKDTVDDLRHVVAGLDGVTKDFAERAGKNFKETGEAVDRFAQSVQNAADNSEKAAPKVGKVGEAAGESATNINTLGNELKLTTDWTQLAGEKVRAIAAPLGDAGVAAAATAKSVAELKEEAKRLAHEALVDAQNEAYAASAKLAELAKAGKHNTDEFRAAYAAWEASSRNLERLRAAAQGAAGPADELAAAYQNLGVKSQAVLQAAAANAQQDFEKIRASAGTTTEGINKTKEAFIAYAKAQLAAVEASDAATKAQTANMLRQLAAQVQALEQFDKLIAKQDESGKKAQDTGQKTVRAGEEGAKALEKTKDAADAAKEGIKDAGKAAESVTVSFAGIGRASFKAVADIYSLVLARKASVQDLEIEIARATARLTEQKTAADALVASYQTLDDAAATALIQRAGSDDRAIEGLRRMAAEARAGKSAFDELDDASLANLAAAADAAAAKIEEIRNKALEARDALRGMADSAQDEIDRLQGNEDAIELRRHKERLRQIEEQAAAAGNAGADEARRAAAAEQQLHALRMQNIAKEKAERDKGGSGGGGGNPPPSSPPPRPGGGGGGQIQREAPAINVTIQGNVIGNEQFVRDLSKRLREHWDRGGR